MSLLGIHLTLLIGPTLPTPAPATLTEALVEASVTQNDTGRSGFQLTFQVGRSGPLDMLDYPFLTSPLLRAFSRVILVVRFDLTPHVLMDGIITNVQLSPSNEPGASTLTVTGEDVTVMMDRRETPTPWPAMSADNIVRTILGTYAQYQFAPFVMPALYPNPPSPTEQVNVQTMTDLGYINFLAARQGYVFYVEPGVAPGTNYAYWGPPHVPPPYRAGPPQKAITFNAGPESNASSVSTSYNSLAATLITGVIQDRRTNQTLPLVTSPQGLRIPLSSMPAAVADMPNVRMSMPPSTPERVRAMMADDPAAREQAHSAEARTTAGLELAEALLRAQATTDASTDNVVTVRGQLDALQYGTILHARALVGLRGVGFSYGGNYYVKSVSHQIRRGKYTQNFTLTREGTGSLTPLVRP